MTDADMIEEIALAIWNIDFDSPFVIAPAEAKVGIRRDAAAALDIVRPELDKMRAEIARLREALKPFAARTIPESYKTVFVMADDIRRARAALEGRE